MQFVIFHGAFGSAKGNWFPQLKEQLEDLGQEVIAPQFPVETWDNIVNHGKEYKTTVQTLKNWLKLFEKDVLPKLKKNEKLCFIGHSLGTIFILHIVQQYNLKLDSAIFVSPLFGPLPQWEFNAANDTFYKKNFDFKKIKQLIPISYVLTSENDPYVPSDQPRDFAEKLGSALIPVRKAEHMNSDVNLNEFPLVFDLCTTRLDLTLWQQYLAHRKQLFGVNFVRERPGSMILFKPEEIFDWQIFLYQHLQKSGFATFYTGIKKWDYKSKYYEDSRVAAERTGNLMRVFLVEQLSDLKNVSLRRHIALDLKAGIHVYLCQLHDVEDSIGKFEFGIWDDEYICYIHLNKERDATSIEINTKKEDLEKARAWKGVIMKSATQIYNGEKDLDTYMNSHDDKVIILSPDEIEDEGTFKFGHLKHEGFATFYIPATPFWNTQSKYYEEARRAAKRQKHIQRVFIAKEKKDFMNPDVIKQIELDRDAGIICYLLLEREIKADLEDLDFGIWDDEYVCIVNVNDENKVINAKLSNAEGDLVKAKKWKNVLLQKATKIEDFEDIKKFAEQ